MTKEESNGLTWQDCLTTEEAHRLSVIKDWVNSHRNQIAELRAEQRVITDRASQRKFRSTKKSVDVPNEDA